MSVQDFFDSIIDQDLLGPIAEYIMDMPFQAGPSAPPDHCVFCSAADGQPHTPDCTLYNDNWAQIPSHELQGVQSYGYAQGIIATPTPVQTANMPSDAMLDAYRAPTQAEQGLMHPTGPVKLTPLPYGQQPPTIMEPVNNFAPASYGQQSPSLMEPVNNFAPALYGQQPQSQMGPANFAPIPYDQQSQGRPLVPSVPTSQATSTPTMPIANAKFTFMGHFKSFAAAQVALQAPADPIIPLGIDNDDWPQLKTAEYIHHYGTRLLAALQRPPDMAPSILIDNFSRQYYFDHQANTLATILSGIEADPVKAEAHIMVCLQKVIDIHEHGLPESILARTSFKEGYKVESDMLCSERMEKVILGAAANKYIAHDILTGHGVDDFVCSPNRYLQRKQENNRVNAKKAFDKKTLDQSTGKTDGRTQARKSKTLTQKKNMGTKGRGKHQTSLMTQLPLSTFNSLPPTPDSAATPNTPADFDFGGEVAMQE